MRQWATPRTLLIAAVALCITAALAATGGNAPPATQNAPASAGAGNSNTQTASDNAASSDAKEPATEVQIYDVADLVTVPGYFSSDTAVAPATVPLESPQPKPYRQVMEGDPPQAHPTRLDLLIALIREQIDPECWTPNGTVGRVQANGSRLTIVNTPANHKRIARLLENLRRAYTGAPLNIDARWLLADDKQLAALRPGSPAPGEIDPAAAKDLPVAYRASVSCFSDQPAAIHSGPTKSCSVFATPIVSEYAVANAVNVEDIQGGLVMQFWPVLSPDGRDVTLDLHADIGLPREGGTIPLVNASRLKPTTAPAVPLEQLDRLDFDVVSFKTTTHLPLGKPMLVSTVPAPRANGKWLCLVVQVSRKEPPPATPAPAPPVTKDGEGAPTLYTSVYSVADLRVPKDYPFPPFKPSPLSLSGIDPSGVDWGPSGIPSGAWSPGPIDWVESLTATIKTIAPDDWVPNGQVGILSTVGSNVVITQTEANHKAIGQLLEKMRRTQPRRIVGIESQWLLLDAKQLAELEAGPNAGAPAVVNLAAPRNQPQTLAAQSMPCFDGQTVYMIAGRMQTYLCNAVPIVSESAVANAPAIAKYFSGGMLEIQPVLDPRSQEVTLAVRAQFHGPQDKWEKIQLVDTHGMEAMRAAALPIESLDRLSTTSASIRTNVRLRMGKQTVVGVVNSPELGQDKVLALVIRVTEQK